jgi:hypothetical protein
MRSVIIAIIALASSSAAGQEIAVITPTGSAADFAALQGAVNAAGIVLLRARAADGTPTPIQIPSGATLSITRSLELLGEEDDGARSTLVANVNGITVLAPGATVAIRGLTVEDAFPFGVLVRAVGSITIEGNTIRGAAGSFRLEPLANNLDAIGKAAVIGNRTEWSANNDSQVGLYAARFIGPLEIANNHFEGPWAFGLRVHACDVSIHDNVIHTTTNPNGGATTGILVSCNNFPPESLTVTRNSIVANVLAGNAIVLFNVPAGVHGVVSNNHIVVAAPSGTADAGGITFADGVVNGVLTAVSGVLVLRNRIEGTGTNALAVRCQASGLACVGNVFRSNWIATFEASVANVRVFPRGVDTVLVGPCGSAEDRGQDSVLTGCAMAHVEDRNLGSIVSDAVSANDEPGETP